MKCPRCNHENASDQKFCGECGARLAASCPACGAVNAAEQKFCGECGARLDSGAPPAKFVSPQSYTPKHLAERILLSKGALEGERKQVTVLFADLKGSMELLADRDPEEARKLLDPVLERMIEAVHRYEGTVNQVMGDGIMALFGAPLGLEDHAARACYAALRMQDTVARHAEELRRLGAVPVQIRVGLNSGEVVVRAIGSDLHMDYTAVGQTTHLAARMEQIATAGSVMLTAATRKLAEGYVQVKPLGTVPVKGLVEPVEVYELTGTSSARTRIQVSAARGLTRFVGRDAELDQLRRALAKAAVGQGQVVSVVGEPGVGKSRLYYELMHSDRTQGWLVLRAGSISYGKATSYLPVAELLRAYFHIRDSDTQRAIQEKVTGKLVTLDEALRPALPALASLLDLPVEDAEWRDLAPQVRRQRIVDAVKRLLLREAQVQPLLLIFEDLHWMDAETQALLDGLVESLPATRLLLLTNCRPEYQQRWASRTYYTQLTLDALPAQSAVDLLENLLGSDPTLEPLKHLLVASTEGNPFFLEECVRALVETGALVGERGATRLTQAVSALRLPATVQAVLAARVDRLDPEEKNLLQVAAVIGKDVPYGLLREVADCVDEQLAQHLHQLQSGEYLYETQLFPDLEYTFKHALTHEVAYEAVLRDKRRALHARIMHAMERIYAQRLGEQVERLAHHALRGEQWREALTYLRQAGERAFLHSATQEAATAFEKALEALSHLPPSRERDEHAIDLRLALRLCLHQLGEQGRIRAFMSEAEAVAKTLGDSRRLVLVLIYISDALNSLGELDEATEYGREALALAESISAPDLQVLALFFLGIARTFQGSYGEGIELFQRTLERVEGGSIEQHSRGQASALYTYGMARIRVFIPVWLSWALAETGQLTAALARGEEALRAAEAMGLPFAVGHAYHSLGLTHLRAGDFKKALSLLERCEEISRSAELPLLFAHMAPTLGSTYSDLGRADDAIALLERARQLTESRKLLMYLGHVMANLAEAYSLTGRVDDGFSMAQRALEVTRKQKQRAFEARTLYIVGNICARAEPSRLDQAADAYDHALAIADQLGMRPLSAQCQLALGRLLQQMGQWDRGHAQTTNAAVMFREMGMQSWVDKAQAALRALT